MIIIFHGDTLIFISLKSITVDAKTRLAFKTREILTNIVCVDRTC